MYQNKSFTDQVIAICEQAAAFIRESHGTVTEAEIITKGHNSLVSYVDMQSEKILIAGLSQLLPGSTFLAEEATTAYQEGIYQWIIDPLDGTTNFLHQVPVYAISVALQHEEEIVLGIVYEVNRKECFHAVKGQGAYLNGSPIQVKEALLKDSLLATGFPYYDFTKTTVYLETLGTLMQQTRGIRRMGAAAVDLAYVACGRFNGFFEYGLAPWDVAAGALLVREAGGIVTDFSGEDNWLHGKSILAGSPATHTALEPILTSRFQ